MVADVMQDFCTWTESHIDAASKSVAETLLFPCGRRFGGKTSATVEIGRPHGLIC